MSYSYYNGKNSTGATAAQNPTFAAPDFTIPADLKPGFYRLRGKVDWDCIDPAGNASTANPITNNGGVIVDTRLNAHGDEVQISRGQNAEGTNGEILNEDGTDFQTQKIPFGQPFTIKVKPAAQFTLLAHRSAPRLPQQRQPPLRDPAIRGRNHPRISLQGQHVHHTGKIH